MVDLYMLFSDSRVRCWPEVLLWFAMSDSVQLQLQVQLPFDFRMSIAQSVIEQAEQAGASYLREIWSEKICFWARCGTIA